MNKLPCFLARGVLSGLVVMIGGATKVNPQTINFRMASAPVCDVRRMVRWRLTQDEALGVQGRDPTLVADRMGTSKATRAWAGKNWYPVDGRKHILCGKLSKFRFYDGWGDEADWNNYFIPGDGFRYLIEYVRPRMTTVLTRDPTTGQFVASDSWHDCEGGTNNCLEAEITPDEHFYQNPWFPKPSGASFSPLTGQTLCTYGPWVYEEAHGDRPEIHPSELYWWKNFPPPSVASAAWTLLLVQDDSNRFDRPRSFSGDGRFPGWRPWSSFPRSGEFSIAFEADPSERPHSYSIFAPDSLRRNVVTSADARARADADSGKNHALEVGGRIVFRVFERQERDDDIGVRFEEVCRDPSKNRLQGYVSITSVVGRGDGGFDVVQTPFGQVVANRSPAEEGYHAITVYKDTAPPRPEPGERPFDLPPDTGTSVGNFDSPGTVRLPTFRPVPASLRRAVSGNVTRLVGDVEVSVAVGGGESFADLDITKVEAVTGGQRQELAYVPDLRARRRRVARGVIKGVPVEAGGSLYVTSRAGTNRFDHPAVALTPFAEAQKPLVSVADAAAWRSLAGFVGAPARTPAPAGLSKARQWQISIAPSYGATRDGQPSPAEQTPFSEELNKSIRAKDDARRRQLFGSTKPFKVEWSFRAVNLSSGAETPVKVVPAGQAVGEREVRVELLPGQSLESSAVRVTFPAQPSGAVYEVDAFATVSDTNGAAGAVHQRLWSHFLPGVPEGRREDSGLAAIASLAGVKSGDLLQASRLDAAANVVSAGGGERPRRARILRLSMLRASEDGLITPGELRGLIGLAKLFDASR